MVNELVLQNVDSCNLFLKLKAFTKTFLSFHDDVNKRVQVSGVSGCSVMSSVECGVLKDWNRDSTVVFYLRV